MGVQQKLLDVKSLSVHPDQFLIAKSSQRELVRNRIYVILFVLISCFLMAKIDSVQAGTETGRDQAWMPVSRLELTPEEQTWVDAHPVIRISGPKSFPPFHYFELDGTLKGMASDYIQALSKMIGIRIEIQENLVWPEVLRRTKSRELDVISCLAYTEDRAEYISFSDPYLSFPLVIITRKDYQFIGGQEDLYNRRIACIGGVVTCNWLSRDGIDFMAYPVKTQLEALESVSLGKADVFIGNLAAVTYRIEKKGLTNLKVAAPTKYGNYNLHIGIRKDWPELLSIFNRALATMRPEEHTAFRNRWMGVKYDYGIQVSDVVTWGIAAGIVAFTILCGIIAWNRSLRLEIEKRKNITASLKNETDFSKAVLRSVHSIVVVTDIDGRMFVFNNAAEKCSGYRFDEVKGIPFWEILISPEDWNAVKIGTKRALLSRTTTSAVNLWITKSGEKRLIQWRNSPLMSPDGNVELVLSTGLDITEQRLAEEATAASRERLAHALEATGASIWEWNIKADTIDIGEEIIHQLGYKKTDLTLTPEGMTRIVEPKSVEAFASLVTLHREDDSKTCVIEVKIRAKNGEWHWLRSQTKVYRRDADNQPEVLLGSLLDITESKRTQEVIVQTEKMLSVGGLAAGMAHELNNPLGAILMSLQIVVSRMDPDSKKNQAIAERHGVDLKALQNYLEKQGIIKSFDGMKEAGLRAADIISNMLQFSRASDSEFQEVELGRLLDKTLELAENDFNLKKQIDFKQVDIVKEYDSSLLTVFCTETEIRQVVLNLISNAFQAMAEKTDDQPKKLVLRTIREDDFAVFEVEDNGPGMDESVRKRIFEPFFTTKPVGLGTGLGLSVAYMIITNNHYGKMEVDSTPGEGTRFSIKLPLDNHLYH